MPRPRILVCDDSSTVRAAIRGLLRTEYECSVATSAEEALVIAVDFNPDVIIADLTMHKMSGIELCQHARLDPVLRLVPIVILSATLDDNARAQCLAAGADDFLSKPPHPGELRNRVRLLVELRQTRLTLDRQTNELSQARALVSALTRLRDPLKALSAQVDSFHARCSEYERSVPAVESPLSAMLRDVTAMTLSIQDQAVQLERLLPQR